VEPRRGRQARDLFLVGRSDSTLQRTGLGYNDLGVNDLGFHRQPGALLYVKRVKEETTMPHYVFLCQDCNKEFTQILHIAELEKGGAVCPHCGGKRVTQKVAAFSAVTSKKS
jgi:putative FmdB family regulatory protein